jgi:hypothetical protein
MEEPSVLDFVLDKLTFWKKSNLTIPAEEEDQQPSTFAIPRISPKKGFWKGILFLLPFIFGIIAQVFGEPDYRSIPLLLFFYFSAGGSLLLLYFFRDWQIEPLIPERIEAEELTIRWIQFLVGVLFGGLSFIFFIGNRFTIINLTLWAISLGLIWWSVWVPEGWWAKIRSAWERFLERGIQIAPWGVLVVGVFLLAFLFRFYALDQVPPEMFSDHAEKLIDITDVLKGNYFIFFPRNTGREAVQMYLTAAVARIFGTGISFTSLKIGTCLAGLFTLPFLYLIGKEIQNKKVGLWAMFFAGVAYWPNVISRVALRFALYPAFAAPTLFFLIRGINRKRWNDFLYAGLALGIGLHGYSPFRVVPVVVGVTLLIYFLSTSAQSNRRQAVFALLVVGIISFVLFLPLLRFAATNYDLFAYRMLSRMTDFEVPLPGSPVMIFFSNLWKSLIMFQWNNGNIWVHSVPGRPALDIISAALFSLGVLLILVRSIKHWHWMDLALLSWIPLMLLPSALSIAFPNENPALNRSGGAIIPVFIVIGIAMENLIVNLKSRFNLPWRKWISWGVVLALLIGTSVANARLVFDEYYHQFRNSAWNTSEIGAVIGHFSETIGDEDHAWVVPYKHWVDTRLVGIHAIGQVRDFALWQHDIQFTSKESPPKLYIYKPEDLETDQILRDLYPGGIKIEYDSKVEGRNFILFYVLQ